MSGLNGAILGIDGALGDFSAALAGPRGESLATARVPATRALEQGLQAIQSVLGATRIEHLAAIAVGTGPGGFAGTRIALSYAKGLALASGRPLVGIPSYDVLEPDGAQPPIVAVVPARKDLACARLTLADGHHVRCGLHEELRSWIVSFELSQLWSAGLAEGDLLRLAERGCDVHTSLLSGPAALRIARLAMSRPPQRNPHALTPDYGFPAITASATFHTTPDAGSAGNAGQAAPFST